MKQAPRMVIPLDIDRGDGEHLAFETAENVLLDILVAVSQDGLGQESDACGALVR
ncbi:MAG: hypothetical protein IPM39_12765 [Chloroflexi bacterium]|nr:hypothetical protein [Chloroflexota bacterium]